MLLHLAPSYSVLNLPGGVEIAGAGVARDPTESLNLPAMTVAVAQCWKAGA